MMKSDVREQHRTLQKGLSLRASKERGAVLIVSLVMLTILTIIAVGTATDIGLQSNMARNSQVRLNVFNLAHSELLSQFVLLDGIANRDALMGEVERTQDAFDADELGSDTNIIIDFEVRIPLEDQPVSSLTDGSGINPSTINNMIFEFHAITTLDNTGASSDQSLMVKLFDPNGINQ